MKEQEIIERLREENEEFMRLEREHKGLDIQIAEIDKKRYLTPEEELGRKRMQKEKLYKKDMIATMIRQHM